MKRRIKNQAPGGRALGGTNAATKPHLHLKYTTLVKSGQDMTPGSFVKIQPEVLLHAARHENGGAARLFFLAKHFNQSGCRTINKRDFMRWLQSLGISRRVSELWLARALQIGLMTRRDEYLDLKRWARVYAILGVFSIYKRAELIPLNTLTKRGWLAWVWAAYCKKFEGRPISQAALRQLTEVPERAQRNYERLAGVVNTRQIALDGSRRPDQLTGIREHERPGAFAYTAGDCIAWGLPNSRQVNGVEHSNKGRSRKIQKELSRSCNKARDDQLYKVFYSSEKALKQGLNKLKRLGINGFTLPPWVYIQAGNTRFWDAVRV